MRNVRIFQLILQYTKSDSGKVSFNINTCGFYKVNNNGRLTLEFDKLEKLETEQKSYINVKFNEIKIFHISLDGINDENTSCGLILTDPSSEGYHITYSVGYYIKNRFDNMPHILWCTIRHCDLGLVFFDRKLKTNDIQNVNEVHTVEHAVLMIVKSIDNKMLLGTRPYHKVDKILTICPYINWVPKNGLLEFIPEDHIKDNGFFEDENGYAHVVVPLYKKNYNAEEFICGKLKQPTLPDLLTGFKLEEYHRNIDDIVGEINPLNEEIKCQPSDDPQHHYHFGYSEIDTNNMSEIMMDAMAIRDKDSNHKFYAGQKIYIYSWDDISSRLKYTHKHTKLINPEAAEPALCIKNLKSDIKANILPTIGSVDSIQKHHRKNIFYRLIKSDDLYQNFTFRCLSKVEGINKAHMDEFYSRTAEFSIKNEEKPNIIYSSSRNEVTFDRKKIDSYGSYRCKESRTTKFFNKSVITMDKVYYLPDEDSELSLGDIKNNNKQYVGCIKQYESLGEIKKIRIEFGENVRKPIDIVNFSNATDEIDIKENLVTYKAPKDVYGVIVTCIYQTPAETTFYTKRQISFVIRGSTKTKNLAIITTNKDKTVDEYVDNSTSWIAVIVVIVVLSCIIMIVVAHIIVRRTKKRKVGNSSSSSLSYSGSSSLSKSGSKGSSGMSGIEKTSTGQLKDASNLIVIKMKKNGNDAERSTFSTDLTGNSTSTDFSKNYFKNVKFAAK